MKNKIILLFIIVSIISITACHHAGKDNIIYLVSKVEPLKIREQPDINSKSIGELTKNEQLIFAGNFSEFTSVMSIHDSLMEDVWVKVRSEKLSKEGWVFAGQIGYDKGKYYDFNESVKNARTQAFFTKALYEKIQDYKSRLKKVKSLQDFATCWQLGDNIKKELEQVLNQKLSQAGNQQEYELPDWFWVNGEIPGYVLQKTHRETQFGLLRDFKFWKEMAALSPETDDDKIVALYLQIYTLDGTESEFPDFLLLLKENTLASTLGKGQHLLLLKEAEILFKANSPFGQDLTAVKKLLLDDVLRSKFYWESSANITEELEAILKANFSILDSTDKEALTLRIKDFKSGNSKALVNIKDTGL